ncbi:hypothetical protein NP493_1786g00025 [Ridgeia piscesae]|uniref:Protein FAM221A n=1 Tax=Ridgeia piscesae TaxID=27915 RepID=A0AAD9JT57_RIDPI|nr:hypothetical protein NP493_1786g00025 [Ridgeia piscesae]
MSDRQYHLKFDGDKAAAVDAYLEYRRIVGDDDGGELFNPDEYDTYKKKVLPMRLKNRLFTSWTNSSGMDCKQIGPETPCFCQHRYKQHKTDFETVPEERPISLPCQVRGCHCTSYHYIPLMGGTGIRCKCKHPAEEHSEKAPYRCKKSVCQSCAGFRSSYTCGCGSPYNDHEMIVETQEEREARGHPVGMATPYQAMGGLTGYSSLAEGYMRLDPSGRGAPSEEFLKQEITSSDHAFLRGAVPSIQAHRRAIKDYGRLDEDMAERMSSLRKPNESEMDFYERRYQERLKAEKSGARAIQPRPGALTSKRPTPGGSTSSRVASGMRAPSGRTIAGKGRGVPRS